MAINEETLNSTITELQAKLTSMEVELQKGRNALYGLIGIKLKPDDKKPIDAGTGAEITDERRQDIYDNCKPKADAIINTN